MHNELVKLLPTGVSGKDQVAQALNMSTRTLYNKLESAGTTYREVLDNTRRSLAEEYFHAAAHEKLLQPTAIVHEAYLRLARNADLAWRDRSHFFAISANAMRNVLVDAARRAA